MHDHRPPSRLGRRLAILGGTTALVAAGWATTAAASSAPPADTTSAASSAPPADTAAAAPVAVNVTLTDTGIEGLPTDLTAGLIDVTVDDQTEGAGGEIDFARVEPGTDPAQFATDLAAVFTGKPFPAYLLDVKGIVGQGMTVLQEGSYFAVINLASNLDRDATADDVKVTPLTVGPGNDDATIPPTDGSIRAGDYLFDVDVAAGGKTVTFTNTSDNQFHFVLLVDFGTNDPAAVEAALPTLLTSDQNSPPPDGIDMSQMNFDFGASGVMGPGSSGTFDVTFESGHTYAAMCFVSDVAGGLPHAISHHMYKVFQVA